MTVSGKYDITHLSYHIWPASNQLLAINKNQPYENVSFSTRRFFNSIKRVKISE